MTPTHTHTQSPLSTPVPTPALRAIRVRRSPR